MQRSASTWDEDYVLSLPQDESDWFERKNHKLLDLTAGANEGKVRQELAKQLSAFANTGGGQIIYGLSDDDGKVDNGGVSESVHNSTKGWLEDIMPTLTEVEIVGVNVYPITAKKNQSAIEQGKALYVVDVPDSDRAPHQSTVDHRYYVRLGGKSRPASHRLIEDIRNRAKHPNIQVSVELGKLGFEYVSNRLPTLRGKVVLPFRIAAKNTGVLALNTCFCFQVPGTKLATNANPSEFTQRWPDHSNGDEAFWEMANPFYPGMSVMLVQHQYIEYESCEGISNSPFPFWRFPDSYDYITKVPFRWRVFADNAPIKEGCGTLNSLGFNQRMKEAIYEHPELRPNVRLLNIP